VSILSCAGPRRPCTQPGLQTLWGASYAYLVVNGHSDIRDLPHIDELKTNGLLEAGPAITVSREFGDLLTKRLANGVEYSILQETSQGMMEDRTD